MLTRAKKGEMLAELQDIIKNSASIVFVNFHGLRVSEETKLRKELRDKQVSYKVFKKTLVSKVLKEKSTAFSGELPNLPGEVSISYSYTDNLAPAREVFNFQKNCKALQEGMLNILGGVLNNEFVPREKMLELAMIPSKEVLYAKFVNILNSPMQKFLYVLRNKQ